MPSELINPNNRNLYTAALSAPAGFTFDSAVVTSFSSQLEFLIEAPVHLALYSANSSDIKRDPLLIMDSVRRYSKRISVFYQKGRMIAPKSKNILYGLLEPFCYEVEAPKGGVFHPKLWFIRFKPDKGNSGSSYIRLVVLSRNLTHDQSWDIILQLESKPVETRIESNAPLVDFLNVLPSLASRSVSSDRLDQIKTFKDELPFAQWDLPQSFSGINFYFHGLSGKNWEPGTSVKALIISPFCSSTAIAKMIQDCREPVALISRLETFAELGKPLLNAFSKVQYINPDISDQLSSQNEEWADTHGLHAKIYILEKKAPYITNTHLITGSANATVAGMGLGTSTQIKSNVEVLVELIGNRTAVGRIEDILSVDSLGEYLCDLDIENKPALDSDEQAINRVLEEGRKRIVDTDWSLSFLEKNSRKEWQITLTGEEISDFSGLTIHAWPVSLDENRAIDIGDLHSSSKLQWKDLALEEVTQLVAFKLSVPDAHQTLSLVLFIQSEDDLPIDREATIIRSCIKDKASFLRYLLMLLDDPDEISGVSRFTSSIANGSNNQLGIDFNMPVLEELVRISNRNPERLKDVSKLISKLKESEDYTTILSENFLKLWDVFEGLEDNSNE